MNVNRQVRVVKRASGIPDADVFAVIEAPVPPCPADGVLLRVLYASVDPAMRGWVSSERNYRTVADNTVMPAEGVAEVIASECALWTRGDIVYGSFGWQQFAAVDPAQIHWRIDVRVAPAPVWLGSLGLNGITAWLGFRHFGRALEGETVLVSTAAGTVGSVVAALARASGLRAVGITGGADKVRRCVDDLGYAQAIDYKSVSDLERAVADACPSGIDLFYDNTGGAIADAVFTSLKVGARIVQCGTAAIASWIPPPTGPRRERDMLVKRLSWFGFVVMDHAALHSQAIQELIELHAAGRLDSKTHVLEGLDAAPSALSLLYSGRNEGRLCIKI